MALRVSKRQRLHEGSTSASAAIPLPRLFPNDPSTAATDEDKRRWNGFCEIESEPVRLSDVSEAFFNVMLKQFGVKGVKVQEVVSLDKELLAWLPRPVYGLIFLYKWREDDPVKQEPSCPPNIWFANQTIDNACASIALLNIVNNISNIDLGEHLQQFKDFTSSFTPALRGDAIGNFEFVKQIHNSFARRQGDVSVRTENCVRKIDMLNGDLFLKNGATAGRRSKKKSQGKNDSSDTSFHFIAFVPIDGKVWKLDGLERQPQSIGKDPTDVALSEPGLIDAMDAGVIQDDDWLGQVKPDIEARMGGYEDGQIEFAVLSLVKDPLLDLVRRLAVNVKGRQAVSAHLNQVHPDWQDFTTRSRDTNGSTFEDAISGPNEAYNLIPKAVETAVIPEAVQHMILDGSTAADLLACHQGLVTAEAGLWQLVKNEVESNRRDEERAASRRHDHSPLIQSWIRTHARRGVIKTIIERWSFV
ncbi:MAG: hypothetical protein Q9187_000233 [Circinaria calcarea]